MEDQVQIKLEFEGSLRRATVAREETLAKLKQTVCALLSIEACDFTYLDEEGDVITVGSDLELKQLLAAAIKDKRILRFTVKSSNKSASNEQAPAQEDEAEEQEEEAPKEPEFPFANLARALSEPETVQRVQAVFQSSVLTDAITRFARTYVESRGDAALAGLLSAQSIPALLGLLAELVNEVPVLKDLQELIMQHFLSKGGVPFAQAVPGACGPWGMRGGPGFRGWGGHHRGGPQQHCGQGHPGVFCDGCSSDQDLKSVSIREGHMTHRGFIRGNRFKSQTVHDFDLCESCKNNTERFPDSAYGPFNTIAPQGAGEGFRGQKRCWGWQRPHCNPEQSWRHHGVHPGGHHGEHHGHHGEHQGHHGAHGKHTEAAPAAAEAQPQFDFLDAIKDVIKKGTQAFSESQTQGELSEIARAIAESLREPVAEAAKAEQPKADVKSAEPVEQPQAAPKNQDDDPFVKWAQQLSQLQTLGFDRLETYIAFLEEEKGDLERVVNRIVRRDM